MQKSYTENASKVVSAGKQFEHVMAITLNPQNMYEGIVRCIVSRDGDVAVSGYIDRSQLFVLSGKSLKKFSIGERLKIKNEVDIIQRLSNKNLDLIGLEDPDIFHDEKTKLFHLYFTIAFIGKHGVPNQIHLGHAVGRTLHTLEMTMPVLKSDKSNGFAGAKEVSIAPVNSKGVQFNLFESSDKKEGINYSVVRIAKVTDMGKPWKFGGIIFHPGEHSIKWIGGHASPGPLLPRSFIDIGPGRMVGIMNGREANKRVGNKTIYGIFSVGLFVFNYEKGIIEWVSPKYFIRDSEAKTITFASQFVETKSGEGILYAHVDDSFVRSYTLRAEDIKKLLPKK